MAGSWRSDAALTRRAARVLGLVLGLAVHVAVAAAPLEPRGVVHRLGTPAGYATVRELDTTSSRLGGITKPIVSGTSARSVELELDDLPPGRLSLSVGLTPTQRGHGPMRCEARLAGRERRLLATLALDGESPRWASADVPLTPARGTRLVMDCDGADGSTVTWAQPVFVPAARSGPAPLIVVISLDTLRADHVSGFGAPAGATPALERIGREGIRFTDATAEGTWTIPSHFALFYGRLYGYPSQRGPAKGLAQLLAERGFVTAAFTGGGYVGAFFRFHLGFDHFVEYDARSYGGSDIRALPDELDDALHWIERFDGTPLFLFLHTYAVHELTPEEADWAARHVDLAQQVPGVALIVKARALYADLVRRTDATLEPLLARLRALSNERPVLLVVLSDHGEAFGEHGNFRHGDEGPRVTLHDEVIRIPLLVWGPPMVAASLTSSRPTMLGDVAPTILEAAGLRMPPTMSGTSLWKRSARDATSEPALRDGGVGSVSRGARGWALRSASYKLIFEQAPGRPPHVELYAIRRDPAERRNLASRYPRAVAALTRRLSRRVTSLTGAVGSDGLPPRCPSCGYHDMAAFWDGILGTAATPTDPMVDAATRERLRALGYTDH